MNAIGRSGMRALVHALWAALQWRLLLLWIVAMSIPTAIVAMPIWSRLGNLLDHSVHSAEWARQFDALAASDVVAQLGGLTSVSVLSVIVTLLLSPLLTGMAVTAIRAPRSVSFGELLHGGASEYWPLFRLLLWAALPFGIAAIIGVVALAFAIVYGSGSILQSQADSALHAATIALVVLLVLAHAMVELGRAQLAADPELRSGRRALGRGIGVLMRRPFSALGIYVVVSILGYLLVLLLAMLRVRTTANDFSGFIAATVLTQSITVAIAWQRTARLFALTDLVRTIT
jgi:hypothetical protein